MLLGKLRKPSLRMESDMPHSLQVCGEQFALDSERFEHRKLRNVVFEERRYDGADRYLLMSGDISGFARHPRRRILLLKLPDQK